jgi:hypothetical protein
MFENLLIFTVWGVSGPKKPCQGGTAKATGGLKPLAPEPLAPESANFARLVVVCIEVDFCHQYLLETSRLDLHNAFRSTDLQSQFLLSNICRKFAKIHQTLLHVNFSEILPDVTVARILLNFVGMSPEFAESFH